MEQNNPGVYVAKDPVGQLIIKFFVHVFLYFPSAAATGWAGVLYLILGFLAFFQLAGGHQGLLDAVNGILPEGSYDESDILSFVGWIVFGYAILSEVASLVRKPKKALPWRKALVLWTVPAILGWTIFLLVSFGDGAVSGTAFFCIIHVASIVAAIILKRLGDAITAAVATAASGSEAVPPQP